MSPTYAALVAHVEACRARGRLHDAEPALGEIVALNPREHFAWSLLGLAALQRGEAAAGEQAIRRALALDRNNAQYLNLLGVALGEQGRLDEAQSALRKSLKQRPAHAEAHYNLGKVLEKADDLAGARAAYRRAAAIDPDYPGATYMYARALFLAGEFDAAEQVLASAPEDDWNVVLLGRVRAATRGPGAQIALYREAAARLPESGMLWRQLAHALLGAGEWREGWAAYAKRDFPGPAPRTHLPPMLADDLRGTTVRLLPEQGLGDVLFFLRFGPELRARGARVEIVAPRKLVGLLAGQTEWAAVSGEDEGRSDDRRALDLSVADLPGVLGADDTPPALGLVADPERVRRWKARLAAAGSGPYVAVTWRGGTDFRRRGEFGARIQSLVKAVQPQRMGAALRGLSGTIVCLQRSPDARELEEFRTAHGIGTVDASAANDDLLDATALLEAVDGYVGVSNTNTHLRAAIGRRGITLVPFPAEWRWMHAGDGSPWFPGFEVLRQGADRDWTRALERARAALASLPASGSIGAR